MSIKNTGYFSLKLYLLHKDLTVKNIPAEMIIRLTPKKMSKIKSET